jgi:hypothetical protein
LCVFKDEGLSRFYKIGQMASARKKLVGAICFFTGDSGARKKKGRAFS